MYGRWFNTSVVLLWLATMSWLLTKKVLPPLLVGDPPSYQAIVEAKKRQPPVGWEILFGGRRLGWALSTSSPLPGEGTQLQGRVHFDELPLAEITPGWMHTVLKLVDRPLDALQIDARSTVIIDSLGRLSRFRSVVRLNSLEEAIDLSGSIDGTRLALTIRSGDFSYTTDAYIPPDALLGDSLSPQTQLPGLRAGQTWTEPTYSPLRPPNNPLEILRATVEGVVPIVWNGRPEDAWLVTYRSDSGLSLRDNSRPLGRLWVRRDGTVLKQEAMVLDSPLMFVRLPEEQTVSLAEELGRRP